jgi:hypothetical protein
MHWKYGQDLIDRFRNKRNENLRLPRTTRNIPKNFNIIAVSGSYFSGSGAVVDLLAEFDLSAIIGVREIYSKNNKNVNSNEIKFFTDPKSIFNLIDSFFYQTSIEQDLSIKQFIYSIYNYYDENNCKNLYGKNYLKSSIEFLESILLLDEYTKDFMKNKRYPSSWESNDTIFDKCSFMYGPELNKYIYYQFKSISPDEFNTIVCNYFYDFFQSIAENGFIVCDQLLSSTLLLDRMNFYMNEHPIKEICVWRDPRDQYISAFRNDINNWLPRTSKNYIHYYNQYCVNKLNNKSINRLPIRLEELIFDYKNTLEKISDFTGIDLKKHIKPQTVFDPNISKNNVGAWKYFINQNLMSEIEKNLKEYCYYGEL